VSDQEEDFATMFEASVKARQFSRGQTIEGTIVAIGPKVAFVNVGGKGEAEIDVNELKDADGDIEVSPGDRISAMVVSTSGGIVLSRKGVRNAATQRELEDAFRAGLAVEGKVAQVVKGGYEVRVARERAFCPLSQIDIVRTDDPASSNTRTTAKTSCSPAASFSKTNSAPAPPKCASRSCRARCSPAGSHRSRSLAPSWILAEASKACCMSRR
jgi:ribosomal protein S1